MKMVYLRDVVTLRLDADKCMGCGRCLEVCPHGVFALDAGKIRIADRDACMECGACARNCPVRALWVKNGVGCAEGILNSTLGLTSNCCGESQSCCCGESEDETMNDTVKDNGKKKGFFALLKESIAKSNDGCGPGCGCHVAEEKRPKGKEAVGDKKDEGHVRSR